jgi:hypothetical protein
MNWDDPTARQSGKQKGDHRRTITPAGARISLINDGFTVFHAGEVIAEVQWPDVKRIFAYSRVMNGRGTLCLAFELPQTSVVMRIKLS